MTETKWTPGPWAIVMAKEPTDGGIDHAIVAPLAGKSTVIAEAFQVVGDGVRAPSQANAQLISAAPDMADALNKISEWSEHTGNAERDRADAMDRLNVCKELARSALKKAKGEA